MNNQGRIIQEILEERKKQDKKWGEQNHTPMEWLPILMEEVGEASKAALEPYFRTAYPHFYRTAPNSKYRKEIIQVAAVTLAMLECYDRNQR